MDFRIVPGPSCEFSQPRARFRPPEELEHLHVSSSESDRDDGERGERAAATSHAASSRARRATRKQVVEERDGHRDWMTWWNTQWIGFLGTIFTGKIFSYEKWKKSDGFRWRCSQENQSQSLVTLVWPSGQWPKLLMSLFGDIDFFTILPMCLCCLLWLETSCNLIWHNFIYFLYEKQIPLHVSRNWYLDKNISWPLHRPKTRWPTTAGSQEPDPAETFVVVKGESSRVPNGCRCVLCGKTVDVMRDHDAWAWRHQNFSGPLSYKLVINPVYYSYII